MLKAVLVDKLSSIRSSGSSARDTFANLVLGTLVCSTGGTVLALYAFRFWRCRQPDFITREQRCLKRAKDFVELVHKQFADIRRLQQNKDKGTTVAEEALENELLSMICHDVFHEHAHCYSVLAEFSRSSWSRDENVLEIRRLAQRCLHAAAASIGRESASSATIATTAPLTTPSDRQLQLQQLLTEANLHNVPVGIRLKISQWWLESALVLRGARRAFGLLVQMAMGQEPCIVTSSKSSGNEHEQQQTNNKNKSTASNSSSISSTLAADTQRIIDLQLGQLHSPDGKTNHGGSTSRSLLSRAIKFVSGATAIFRLRAWPMALRLMMLAAAEASRCAAIRYYRVRCGGEVGGTSSLLGGGRPLPLGFCVVNVIFQEAASRFAFSIDLDVSRALGRQAAYALAMADTSAIESFGQQQDDGKRRDKTSSSNSNKSGGYSRCLDEVRSLGNKSVCSISGLVQLSVQVAFFAFDIFSVFASGSKNKMLYLGIAVLWQLFDDGVVVRVLKFIFRTPRKILDEMSKYWAAQEQHNHQNQTQNQQPQQASTDSSKSALAPVPALPAIFDSDDVRAVVTLNSDERAILSNAAAMQDRVPELRLNKDRSQDPITNETLLSLRVLGLDVVATLAGLRQRQRSTFRSMVKVTGNELLDPHGGVFCDLLILMRRYTAFHIATWALSGNSSPSSSALSAVDSNDNNIIPCWNKNEISTFFVSLLRNIFHRARRTFDEIAAAEPSMILTDSSSSATKQSERWVSQVEYHLSCFDDLDTKLDIAQSFTHLERLAVFLAGFDSAATIDREQHSSDANLFLRNRNRAVSIEFKNVTLDYNCKNSSAAAAMKKSSNAARGDNDNNSGGGADRTFDNPYASPFSSNAGGDDDGDDEGNLTRKQQQEKQQEQQTTAAAAVTATTSAALQNVSFTIRAGETVGIVAQSGGGKTSLLKLLLRLYDPTPVLSSQQEGSSVAGGCVVGSVLVDGTDLRTVRDIRSWRRNGIAYVDQHPLISNDATVRENVEFGRPLPRDVVQQALEDANCMEFVEKLPRGADSVVGFRLSSGERQRLAIARAFARRAPLLLLDEATAMLDADSEGAVVQGCFDRHRGKKKKQKKSSKKASAHGDNDYYDEEPLSETTTTLIVAHRLSTLKRAHRMLVLEGGTVVGFDRHENLLETCDIYRAMYERQCLMRGVSKLNNSNLVTNASAISKAQQKLNDIAILRAALLQLQEEGSTAPRKPAVDDGDAAADDGKDKMRLQLLQSYLLPAEAADVAEEAEEEEKSRRSSKKRKQK